jgi:hypothetical protein
MEAERIFVPAKNGWRNAICVIDPAERRLAANDNVSRAMRVLRWDRRLRVLWRCLWALGCVTMLGDALLAISQQDVFWTEVFIAGALVALWGALGK